MLRHGSGVSGLGALDLLALLVLLGLIWLAARQEFPRFAPRDLRTPAAKPAPTPSGP
jgi:hypothetical protein